MRDDLRDTFVMSLALVPKRPFFTTFLSHRFHLITMLLGLRNCLHEAKIYESILLSCCYPLGFLMVAIAVTDDEYAGGCRS